MVRRMKDEADEEIMARVGASSASYTEEGRLVLDGVVVEPEEKGIDSQGKANKYMAGVD